MADYAKTGWVDDDGSLAVGTPFSAAHMNNLEAGVRDAAQDSKQRGTLASRPPASAATKNWIWIDENGRSYYCDGTQWWVFGEYIAPGAVTRVTVAPMAIGSNELASAAVGSAHLQASAVVRHTVAASAIVSANMNALPGAFAQITTAVSHASTVTFAPALVPVWDVTGMWSAAAGVATLTAKVGGLYLLTWTSQWAAVPTAARTAISKQSAASVLIETIIDYNPPEQFIVGCRTVRLNVGEKIVLVLQQNSAGAMNLNEASLGAQWLGP